MNNNSQQFNINIFDRSPLAYCVCELVLNDDGKPVDWIFRYCNQALADIGKFKVDDLMNKPFFETFPGVDRKWLNLFHEAAYDDIPSEFDEISNISDRYLHIHIMPTGQKGYCSCLIRNIRKNLFEKLQKNEQLEDSLTKLKKEKYVLDKLCEDFTAVYNIELNSGRFDILKLGENTNAIEIIGGDLDRYQNFDEYAAEYAKRYIADEDRDSFLDWFKCGNLKKRLQNEERIIYYYKSVPNGVSQRFFETQAIKVHVEDNQFLIFMGFRYVDNIVNKEKQIQKKLQDALDEARLNNEIISAIGKTYQYISRIDLRTNRFEEISSSGETHRLTGVQGDAHESILRKCRKNVADEYQEELLKFLDLSTLPERLKEEEMIATEYRTKDGNWHILRFVVKKRDDNGEVTHVLCLIRITSDTKRREQSLLYLAEEAKKEAAFRMRFLSNMSHDIRTPMNGIIGMIDLANHYPDDLEIQQKCRDKIKTSSEYLVSMVNDILDMNKLESGSTVSHEMTFDLTELLSNANATALKKAADKNIDYVVDWDRAIFTHQYLIGNPLFAERVLSNIADNAIKFTNPGGSVRVWCKEEQSDGDNVVFEFGCSDNGIGMSKEFLTHAYDIFSQENESSRSKYEGTGIGLAMAKRLVDRLDGTIDLQSEKGVGTTCIVRLPFKIGEAEEISKPVNYEEISVKGLRALVVEDNELNMEIARFMLENNGVETVCAVDGEEAVEIFEKSDAHYFDVIFMDIMMPKLNGLDATRKIRAMERDDAATVPIIAMSANAFSDDIINCRISGMNLHIAKPLDESKMINAIKKCIC